MATNEPEEDRPMPGPPAALTVARAVAPSGLSEPAFKDLYGRLLRPVFHYVRYRLGPEDANDVTADVFARAWGERSRFDPLAGNAEA
jgi:DNA-directed RNA polymerase specialized sigma24 family protein